MAPICSSDVFAGIYMEGFYRKEIEWPRRHPDELAQVVGASRRLQVAVHIQI